MKIESLEKNDTIIARGVWMIINEINTSTKGELLFSATDQDGRDHYFLGDEIDHIYERIRK